MFKKNRVAVVIPVYKDTLTYFETLSLTRCVKVLAKYPVIFIAPYFLNTNVFTAFLTNKEPHVVRFDEEHFKSIAGYNKLMLSADFYKRFLNYKFILIYQLDAFVFKDDLTYWCNKNYDYIGAPQAAASNAPGDMQFLKNYSAVINKINTIFGTQHKISNVGNGGLSLRKTRTFYILLKLLKNKVANWGTYNEDVFFRYWGNLLFPLFRLPDDETALRFSVETSPKKSLEKLNYELPFGCHAFEKYDFEVWKPFVLPGEAK
jgi:hypothetical protein